MPRIQRFGLHARLADRWGRFGDALWTLIAAGVLVSVNAWLAIVVDKALLFASLGPIIFQLLERPVAAVSSPRSTILGNGIAIAVGYGSLAFFGLLGEPSVTAVGVSVPRALAAGVSLAVTGGLLLLARSLHPPAGSTTLLVSLGFIQEPVSLLILQGGVVLVVVSSFLLSRAAGVPVPIWSPSSGTPGATSNPEVRNG